MDEDVLLINIGARSTNLLFKNPDGFFVRNIQLGGNSLTQNIADSIGKPFAKADELKHKFFSDDLDYSDDDSGAKLLTSCSESFMRRMGQEITRSIVNYRRQKGGAAPKRILLNGRGALLEGLTEQLSTSQKVDVEFFDPLQNVTLCGEIDSNSISLRLETSEIIGVAAQHMVVDSAGVNLLPDEVQREMEFGSKKPYLVIAGICLALSPWPVFVGHKQLGNAYEKAAQATQAQDAPLQSRLSQILDKLMRLKISESIRCVEGLVNSKTNWIQFFAELQASQQRPKMSGSTRSKCSANKPVRVRLLTRLLSKGKCLSAKLQIILLALTKRSSLAGLRACRPVSKIPNSSYPPSLLILIGAIYAMGSTS